MPCDRMKPQTGFYRNAIFVIVLLALIFISCAGHSTLAAQETRHHPLDSPAKPASTVVPDSLTIEADGKTVVLLANSLRKFAHHTVTVHNEHTRTDETYSGVSLSHLLEELKAPLGKELQGKALADYVLAEGADGYRAVYSLAEVDPTFHGGDVFVADSQDGKPISPDGPFKLVNTEDKRAARWVRNLVAIRVIEAPQAK